MHWMIYVLVLIVAICAALITALKTRRRSEAVHRERDLLKENGQKIKVDFDQCEIKTRDYVREDVSDSLPTRIEMADALYDQERNYQQSEVIESVLVYKYKYRDQVMQFKSEIILLPVVTLRFRLDQQKFSFIYYDPNDLTKYYFDLEFLGTKSILNE